MKTSKLALTGLVSLLTASAPGLLLADEQAPPSPQSDAGAPSLVDEALVLFEQRRCAEALPLLARAHALSPDDTDVALMLGICAYQGGDRTRARPLLEQVERRGPQSVRALAQEYLELLRQAPASDADRTAGRVVRSAENAGKDRARAGPRRLTVSLQISPEYDGNASLLDQTTWAAQPADGGDGDIFLQASATYRPLRAAGLSIGQELSYRQQFRLQQYNLLLSTSWIGYTYSSDRHRLRTEASFTYALRGGESFYFDGSGQAAYRLRLRPSVFLNVTYTGGYRGYPAPDFAAYGGHTHALRLDLVLELDRVGLSLGYRAVREQLNPGEPYETADGRVLVDDYRAVGIGPALRLRAQLHERVDLRLLGSMLLRVFDAPLEDGSGRRDRFFYGELWTTVECTRWLEAFAGAALIYNDSADPAFSFLRPFAYAGVTATFSWL